MDHLVTLTRSPNGWQGVITLGKDTLWKGNVEKSPNTAARAAETALITILTSPPFPGLLEKK